MWAGSGKRAWREGTAPTFRGLLSSHPLRRCPVPAGQRDPQPPTDGVGRKKSSGGFSCSEQRTGGWHGMGCVGGAGRIGCPTNGEMCPSPWQMRCGAGHLPLLLGAPAVPDLVWELGGPAGCWGDPQGVGGTDPDGAGEGCCVPYPAHSPQHPTCGVCTKSLQNGSCWLITPWETHHRWALTAVPGTWSPVVPTQLPAAGTQLGLCGTFAAAGAVPS